MEIISIILLAVIVAVVLWLAFKLNQKREEPKDNQSMLMIQNQLNDLAKIVHDRLDTTHKSMQSQFISTSKIITDVTERLTKLDETNKQVLSFSEQLQSLENILTNPKQRGILGEYFLEQGLKNRLPPAS